MGLAWLWDQKQISPHPQEGSACPAPPSPPASSRSVSRLSQHRLAVDLCSGVYLACSLHPPNSPSASGISETSPQGTFPGYSSPPSGQALLKALVTQQNPEQPIRMGAGCSPAAGGLYPFVGGPGEENGHRSIPVVQPPFLPVTISLPVPVRHGSSPTRPSWFDVCHLHEL